MKFTIYDVYNKKGYRLGEIHVPPLEDPMKIAVRHYGSNVDYVEVSKKENLQ